MKKLSFTILCYLFFCLATQAQDIILKNNGDEIRVTIKEINADIILFHYFDSTNLALYSIPHTEVFSVTYQNGVKILMSSLTTGLSNKKKEDVLYKIEIRGYHYYRYGSRIGLNQVDELITHYGNQKSKNALQQARKSYTIGTIIVISGIPLILIGAALSGAPYTMLPGGAVVIAGFIVSGKVKKQVRKAVEMYNEGLVK
jgi:hypothetical protein